MSCPAKHLRPARYEPPRPSQLIRSCSKEKLLLAHPFSGSQRSLGASPRASSHSTWPRSAEPSDHPPGDGPGDPTKQQRQALRDDHPETTGGVQPVETHASTRRCNSMKTSLGHVDLTSSQHQPWFNRSLETTSLQPIQPHKDRCIEQKITQLLRYSIAAAEAVWRSMNC